MAERATKVEFETTKTKLGNLVPFLEIGSTCPNSSRFFLSKKTRSINLELVPPYGTTLDDTCVQWILAPKSIWLDITLKLVWSLSCSIIVQCPIQSGSDHQPGEYTRRGKGETDAIGQERRVKRTEHGAGGRSHSLLWTPFWGEKESKRFDFGKLPIREIRCGFYDPLNGANICRTHLGEFDLKSVPLEYQQLWKRASQKCICSFSSALV